MELQGVFLLFSSVRMKSFFLFFCTLLYLLYEWKHTYGNLFDCLVLTVCNLISSSVWVNWHIFIMPSSCLSSLFWWRVGKSTVGLMCITVTVASCFLSPVLIHIVFQFPEHVWFWPRSEHFPNVHNAIVAKSCSFKTLLQMICVMSCVCVHNRGTQSNTV